MRCCGASFLYASVKQVENNTGMTYDANMTNKVMKHVLKILFWKLDMKKILTLLALVSSSICFASSDEILPVDKPVESVASAPVAPAAGRLITGREFLESGGVVASAAGASDLPSHLKCLTVEMNADGYPVNLAWETPEERKKGVLNWERIVTLKT